ncbi:DUF4389 domain-containing protein [Planobispora siamensis]|uniref:DUF4389 domain-containing protein n=1 Tax=Planobispora siamensis TaxID=936338 RepID=A0A8J3WN71_9ACTN|nr:DUF4389 domain-containing protein [Planobispora siamensis]GIH95465.1 hypothetical protein Psi01_60950 [Planobispora siamensis]
MDAYPVRVQARLDEPLNRGLWLVKWLLAIPHYLILGLLWVAFAVLTVIAFFAILFTGRYPRSIFEFNVGVMRWTWRVTYYTYGALGTDRYPPFTLGPAPDYPATLEVDYPARLSRGLVLVKWWLLAIPHYLVVALFTSGSAVTWRSDLPDNTGGVLYALDWGGLIGLLVLIAALILLFTGRYPRGVFDFVLGMNRWALRVAAYAMLMTDVYPPFRLDAGEREPAARPHPASQAGTPPGHVTFGDGAPGEGVYAGAGPLTAPPAGAGPLTAPPTGAGPVTAPPAGQYRSWPGGAIAAVVIGSLLALGGLGTAAAGVATAWFNTQHDSGGFISTATERMSTSAYALTAEDVEVAGQGVVFLRGAVGRMRIQATGTDEPLFIGIAPYRDVTAYLDGVAYDEVTHLAFSSVPRDDVGYTRHEGAAPASAPGTQSFWTAQVSGTGQQTLIWDIQPGDWAIVLMNADASAPVSADVRVGATLPWLDDLVTLLFVTTAVLVAAGAGLIALGVRLAAVPPPPPPPAPVPAPPVPTGSGSRS